MTPNYSSRLTIALLVITLVPIATSTWLIPLNKRESNSEKKVTSSSTTLTPTVIPSSSFTSSNTLPLQPTDSPSLTTKKVSYVKVPVVKKSSLLNGGGFDFLLQNTSCSVKMNTLMCDSLRLTELPTAMSIPDPIEFLDFRNNRIRKLLLGTFYSAPKIKSLFLANNALTHIKGNTFANLTHLTHLDLSHNAIVQIENLAFNGLEMLNVIDLGYNRIQNLSKQIFAQSEGKFFLKELRLNHNELKEFEYDTFHHLFYIDALDLEDNTIENLPENIFALNTRLRDLKLSMNNFKRVPNVALATANVEILDLSSNRFKDLKYEDFKSLKTISRLRISRINSLEKIRDHAFADLINLRQLYIEYNRKLREISPKAFILSQGANCGDKDTTTQCPDLMEEEEDDEQAPSEHFHPNSSSVARKIKYAFYLTEISLKGNALTTLTKDTLPWNAIDEVDLSDNPWRCDCHFSWIADVIVNDRTDEQFICKKPYKHFNQRISEMSKDDFTCSLFENDALIIGGVMLLIVLAPGLSGLCSIGFLIKKLKVIPKILYYVPGTSPELPYVRVDIPGESVTIQMDKRGDSTCNSNDSPVDHQTGVN